MTDTTEMVARAVFKSDDFFGDSYADDELFDWGDGNLKATVDGEINFSAIAPAIEQAGFAIVPVEPTDAMCRAAAFVFDRSLTESTAPEVIYRAMIAAAREQEDE